MVAILSCLWTQTDPLTGMAPVSRCNDVTSQNRRDEEVTNYLGIPDTVPNVI